MLAFSIYGAAVEQCGLEEIKDPHHMLELSALVVSSPRPPEEYQGILASIPLFAYDQPLNTSFLVILVLALEVETNE